MSVEEAVRSVARLWRFPVKSMAGEQLEQAEFTEKGVLGDRVYALIDDETGKVVSAKTTRLFPDLLGCRAALRGNTAIRPCAAASEYRITQRHVDNKRC